MTKNISARIKARKFNLNLPIAIFITVAAVLTVNANTVRESVVEGIRLSALCVIPSLFPFFILSDYLSSSFEAGDGVVTSKICAALEISKASLGCIIIGFICGFPLGIKSATELYANGKISKEECEKLCAVTNNPSFAFIVSGVGVGMRGSVWEGIALYTSVVLSAIIINKLFNSKKQNSENTLNISRQKFNLSLSIKSSALSSIYVSSYIIFFSALLGILFSVCKNEFIKLLFAGIFEIGNATNMISKSKALTHLSSFAMTGFALGFSGISVFMQAVAYLPSEISKRKLLGYKLIQGVLCALLAAIFYYFTTFAALIFS